MNYELCKKVMADDIKRAGFNALAKQTFGLSFENWYQNGFWSAWNQPYTFFDGEKAVSNITVNQMKVLYQGKVRNYIQLGGVMTDTDYRKQGLSRRLMQEVQKDWRDKCDAMFLLANHTVVDFYPKYGFIEEKQYQYYIQSRNMVYDLQMINQNIKKLDLLKDEDIEILLHCYKKTNPFSALQIIENSGLLLFYCETAVRESVYYLPEDDAVIIAERGKDEIICYDIYYDGSKSLIQILEVFCNGKMPKIKLLFTPVEKRDCIEKEFFDEDTHLFVLDGKENIFHDRKNYVPDISYT